MKKFLAIWLLLTTAITANAQTNYEQLVELRIKQFHQNPAEFQGTLPDKFDSKGRLLKQKALEEIELMERNSPKAKIEQRKLMIPEVFATDSAPRSWDRVGRLIPDRHIVRSLSEMDSSGNKTGRSNDDAWSDDYWATSKGKLGARYADRSFRYIGSFLGRYNYIRSNPSTRIFGRGDEDDIDKLSPSEKYDLLLGTNNSNLTDALWREAKGTYDRNGKIEGWAGICHGWAVAAYMVDRPKRAVSVKAADGRTDLTFYPSDIKALASLLWAHTNFRYRFVGGRCEVKNPSTDSNGRILNDRCQDTNPGTWHMAIVNQLGRYNKSFVLDATYDYQVWNQPLVHYEYSYFNPQTGRSTSSLESAKVSRSRYSRDKFKSYRSSAATHFVGISMKATYLNETKPDQSRFNSRSDDASKTVSYLYDLELNEYGEIVGGEWYQRAHPDFIWTVADQVKPQSVSEYQVQGDPLWNGRSALPSNWKSAGKEAGNSKQPLSHLVDSLVELSNR